MAHLSQLVVDCRHPAVLARFWEAALDGFTVRADVEKQPMHLDITASNRAAERERLVALGATIVERFDTHTWMRDPEQNDFCMTDP